MIEPVHHAVGVSLPPSGADTPDMTARGSLTLVLALVTVSWSGVAATRPAGEPAFRLPATIRVRTIDRGRAAIVQVPLEDYVRAAVLSEFAPPSGDPRTIERMLEVQSLVSRTYAVAHLGRHASEGFDVCSTTHCQLYDPGRLRTSRWAAAAAEAVERSRGQVIWYEDRPALAVYHADCGGRTSSAAAIWTGPPLPYLTSIKDNGPARKAHTEWTYSAPVGDIERALAADPRTAVARFRDLHVERRDHGRAIDVTVRGETRRSVSAEVLREVLGRAFGPRAIRSTWFDVRTRRGTVTFHGRGYGHGVGLCQAGALARIEHGTKPTDVIQKYFPGTGIRTFR